MWLLLAGAAQMRAAEAPRYLNSTTFADSVITFNEVMYHPRDGEAALEWIEIHNQLAVLVDLSNWTVSGSVDFRFPVGTRLLGGGFLVIAADPDAIGAVPGSVVLGPFKGQLSDGGERVVLRNHNQRLMDELEYGDSSPWPTAADGSGASLSKRLPGSPSSPAENWRASVQVGGTPGAANFPETVVIPAVVFSEVAPADSPRFWCELVNPTDAAVSLDGLWIRSSKGGEFRFGADLLNAGAHRSLTAQELGFAVEPGDRLFLVAAGGLHVLDAVGLSGKPRARRVFRSDEPFLRPSTSTPGAPNQFALHDEIVINEILYHAPPTYARPATADQPAQPFVENEEQWIELHNRSSRDVALSGWKFEKDIEFDFPAGTTLPAGGYLVVAADLARLRETYAGLPIVGNWRGKLSGRSGHIALRDADDNPVDEVRYFDDAPWPSVADGGGSSLELQDPRADNLRPEAWAPSDQGSKSAWKRYVYRARAINPVKAPSINGFHEFRMGLLADGEVLIDDLTVVEEPDGASRQLIQNSDFNDALNWRLLGNHSHSRVEDDSDQAGNRVLRLVATDARGYMHNQLESTLKVEGTVVPVVAGRTYEIAFRAKWLSGSPLLHAELYYNKVARTTVLDQPARYGTPGRQNSRYITNLGPTYLEFVHGPLIPKVGQIVTVTVRAEDADGVDSMKLWWSVNGGTWQERRMGLQPDGTHTATVPSQALNAVVQFYVEGRDALGAVSTYPAMGRNSRALYRVDSRTARAPRKGFAFVMTQADGRLMDASTNMMSDDRLGTTVVWDNREVYYDCGVHLHGSMFSRSSLDSVPYSLKFPADHKYRGVHRTVQVNRGVIEEIIGKHTQNQTGVPGMYEDIVDLFSHRSGNSGAARLSLAHYNDVYLGSQFENGTRGMLYNMEGIRVLEQTHNRRHDGIKLGMPVGWVGDYDIMNLGNDPEQYRFSTTLRNNRARNDHSPYIAMAKVFSLSGTTLEAAVPGVMDVDQWMRYYALLTLFEVGDTYTLGNPHNIGFYARPSDGKVIALPYDWDFFFSNGSTSPLWGNQNLTKIITRPKFTRLLHGHLLHMIEGAFSTNYLTPYITNFGAVAGQNFNGHLSRVRLRSQYVRSRLPAKIPFEIMSNAGVDFAVETAQITLEGRGWVDVSQIRLAGFGEVSLNWLDGTRWRVEVPLAVSTNLLQLEAFNRRGELVGTDSIGVTTSAAEDSQRSFLRISEIHYHPGAPTVSEALAGFDDADDFEFVEIGNYGPATVSLEGVRFMAGVLFDFTGSSISNLPSGGHAVVVRRKNAFSLRYPQFTNVAGEFADGLGNGGDTLRLVDRLGFVIHEVTYEDQPPWPIAADGEGYSLELIASNGPIDSSSGWHLGPLGGSPTRASAPATALEISNIRFQNGKVTLQFEAMGGRAYRVQGRTRLEDGPWQDLLEVPLAEQVRVVQFEVELGSGLQVFRIAQP